MPVGKLVEVLRQETVKALADPPLLFCNPA
jgi:hypothetical protein